MKKSILGNFNLVQGALYDKAVSGFHEKSSQDNALLDEENQSILTSNLEGLLEQIENRCDKMGPRSLDQKVASNKKEQLKRQLRAFLNVPWHLYDDAELWAALKNYLRHLPSCPLGSTNYVEWSRIQWDYWDEEKIERIQNLLLRLPTAEFKLVKHLFRILHKLSCQQLEQAELGSLELAARLGPYLLWERGQAPRKSTNEKVNVQTVWLVSYMIEHYASIFK